MEQRVVVVGGVTTTVREAGPDDVERLVDLYGRLSLEDIHRRFFSTFRPDARFVSGWIANADKGGIVLVAIEGADGAGPIVGDAGYVPTSRDVAELAMTVDPARRGWLGPYLLDALVEHAREHGFRVLEAEVLAENCSMLGLLRARGCALRPSTDLTTAQVLIATEGDAPVWPADGERPKVLVEGASRSWGGAVAASRDDLDVLVCPGPSRGRIRPCPLLHGDRCPLVDEADAIVNVLPAGEASSEIIVGAHDPQVVVSPPRGASGAEVLDAVRQVIDRRQRADDNRRDESRGDQSREDQGRGDDDGDVPTGGPRDPQPTRDDT